MKKFALIATIVTVLGIVFANLTASAMFFNQPKNPSMLSR